MKKSFDKVWALDGLKPKSNFYIFYDSRVSKNEGIQNRF